MHCWLYFTKAEAMGEQGGAPKPIPDSAPKTPQYATPGSVAGDN